MLDFSGFTILAKRMNCSMALSARAAELCDWYPLSSPRSTVPTVNNRRNVSIYDPDCGRDLVKETQYFPDGTVWRKLCRACIHGTREPGSADKCLVEEMCALGNGWQCLCNGTDIVASEVDMTCTSIPAGEVSAVTLHPAIRSVDVTAITAIDLGDLRRMALSNLSTSFPVIKMVRISGFPARTVPPKPFAARFRHVCPPCICHLYAHIVLDTTLSTLICVAAAGQRDR